MCPCPNTSIAVISLQYMPTFFFFFFLSLSFSFSVCFVCALFASLRAERFIISTIIIIIIIITVELQWLEPLWDHGDCSRDGLFEPLRVNHGARSENK